MAWVAVDKIGEEHISRTEPFRIGDYWIGESMFHLPKSSIKKLIGRELSWNDEAVELK
ncbi:fructan hydrolase [Streptococcus vestibularis]|uniref:fructan hydrolase n=1 Tax=Streptococcus vestibularis TaxID=1343 RepID=UPI0026F12E1B|nr:fructan hydrolase [Streptococcus vestibularis]